VEERLELTHLNAVEKTAILTGKLSVGALMLALGLFALFFLNIFLAIIIGDALNNRAYGFMIITGFYLLLLLIALIFKNKLEMPITNFVIRQLLHKNKLS
jgi:cytochrome c biogenesis protein CcdA